MSTFAAVREIPTSQREVFDFLADGRRHAEWIAKGLGGPLREVVETEHVSGPEVGEGATYRLRQKLGRKKAADYAFRTEVYEPARRLVFRAEGGYDVLFDLEETPTGTRVRCTRDYGEWSRGLVGRLVSRGLKPEYAEPSIAEDLLRIERVLGATTAPPASAETP